MDEAQARDRLAWDRRRGARGIRVFAWILLILGIIPLAAGSWMLIEASPAGPITTGIGVVQIMGAAGIFALARVFEKSEPSPAAVARLMALSDESAPAVTSPRNQGTGAAIAIAIGIVLLVPGVGMLIDATDDIKQVDQCAATYGCYLAQGGQRVDMAALRASAVEMRTISIWLLVVGGALVLFGGIAVFQRKRSEELRTIADIATSRPLPVIATAQPPGWTTHTCGATTPLSHPFCRGCGARLDAPSGNLGGANDVLKLRLAKGEISLDEYERLRAALER